MANIQNELNQINTAVYGKDVRASLANGLEALNTQVNQISSKADNAQTESENAISISEDAKNTADSTQEIVSTIQKNVEIVTENTNKALDTVNKLIGETGLSLTGGTMTGSINFTDGAAIQYNSNDILSVDSNNTTLNINSGKDFSDVKIYGKTEFVNPIQAPNLTNLESAISNVNLIGGSNYGENGITSSEYGFEEKHFYVEEGKTYTITGCGMVHNEGNILYVAVYGDNWKENNTLQITSTSKIIASKTFTATQNGKFTVQLYSVDKTPVTVYWYTICESTIANEFWIPSPADAFDGHYSDNFANEFVRVVNNAGICINDNFNEGCYLKTGIYYTQNDSTMATVQNSPVQVAGYIEVINTDYDVNTPNNGTGMVFQKFVTLQGVIYTRSLLNASATSIWSKWENTLDAQNANVMDFSSLPLSTSTFSNMNYANETGIYLTNTTSTLDGMQNIPILQAGCLEVINSGCSDYMNGRVGIIYQRYTTYENTVYTRVYYAGEQRWSSWICLTPSDESAGFAVKLNCLGEGVTNLVLENNTLKVQNEDLGKQVVNLIVENQTLKKQVQLVANAMVQLELKK